jgi:hypothetical protein
MPDSSTAVFVYHLGHRDGVEHGRREGGSLQWRRLLMRLGRRRFGEPDAASEQRLTALEQHLALERFEELAQQFASAADWTSWIAAPAPAGPPPPLPDYAAHYEFDPTPTAAGFDEYAKMTMRPPRSMFGPSRPSRPEEVVMHLRFQKWHEPNLDEKMYRTSRRLRDKYKGCRVETVMLLLFPMAEGPGLTGRFRPPSRSKKSGGPFEYRIARVWKKSPEEYFSGGLGVVALAPLSNVSLEQLPEVVRRMEEIIARDAKSTEDATMIWSASYWYMGLRYPADLVNRLTANVQPLLQKDKTYLAIKASGFATGRSAGEIQGKLEATRAFIRRFENAPTDIVPAEANINAISDPSVLERMAARLVETV